MAPDAYLGERAASPAEVSFSDPDFRRLLGDLAAGSLPGLSLAVAGYYVILGVAHPFFAEGGARLPMTVIALATAAMLGALAWRMRNRRFPPAWGHFVQGLMGAVVLINCVGHMALTLDSLQSTNVSLAIVAGGLLIYHPYLYVGYVTTAVAGWGAVTMVAAEGLQRSPHFAFMILGAVLISIVAYRQRIRALLELEGFQERLRIERERRRFEEHARNAQRFESLGRMAGGVAHDFNNLLTIISGNAELWLETSPSSSTGREQAQEILKASGRAAELTRQILLYSGRARSDKRPLDLAGLVGEMQPLLRSMAGSLVRIQLSLERERTQVNGDADQLRQVVANLVSNSIQAMDEEGGTVSVRVERAAESVRLTVEDTGCGIAPENLPQVYDPFFSTKGSGRGLGLAVVHGIVHNHHGDVQVANRPERGACVTVLFPAADERSGPLRRPPLRRERETQPVVLIVDDEPGVRSLAARALEAGGFETLQARNGKEAEKTVGQRTGEIDLIVLDLILPGEDGFEVLDRLRAAGCRARVILISGYSEAGLDPQARREGVDGFLQKPFRPSVLAEAAARSVASAE